jgi:hypothetical protein
LGAVVQKAMTLSPKERYPSALAIADDIECWLADEPVQVYRDPWLQRTARWARQNPAWVQTIMTAMVLILIFSNARVINRVQDLFWSWLDDNPTLGVTVASDRVATTVLGISGVLVLEVHPDSSAEKGGIRPTITDEFGQTQLGDIIIALDDTVIENREHFANFLGQHAPGDMVQVTVRRGAEKVKLRLTLQEPFWESESNRGAGR